MRNTIVATLFATVALAGPVLPSPAAEARAVKAAGGGTVRALVAGADDYQTVNRLKGAVADARDLAATLGAAGVTDLTVLIDRQLTRASFIAAMEKLVAASKSGDLVFITIAGHGTRLPERVKGSSPDGKNEAYVLPAYDVSRPEGRNELIFDQDLKAWLRRLDEKGVDVIFAADTCHGGGLTRGWDPRAGAVSYRSAPGIKLPSSSDLAASVGTPQDAATPIAQLKRVTFLGAEDKTTTIPEIPVVINGTKVLRGALSYALARGVSGAADRDTDGRVTRSELYQYMRQVTYQLSDSVQKIVTEPALSPSADDVVIRLDGAQEVPPPLAASAVTLKIAAADGDRVPLDQVARGGVPFAVVDNAADADLVFDRRARQVLYRGTVIAHDAAVADVPAIVDRTAAIGRVVKLSEGRPQTVRLEPNGGVQRPGNTVTFRAEGLSGRFLSVVNIAGDGTVQNLAPRFAGEEAAQGSDSWSFATTVSPPYGADQVIAVSSGRPLDALVGSLRALEGARRPLDLVALLERAAAQDATLKIGTAALVTGP